MTAVKTDKASLNGIALGTLKRERLRTGLGSHAISALFRKKKDAPTPAMIDNWLSGKQKFAKSSHLELVLMTYAKQPDALPDGTKAAYVTMTDALRNEIRQIHGRSASGYLDEAPERFSRAQLSHLMTGRKKTLSRIMLDFFRNQAEKVPEKRHQTPYPPKPDLEPLDSAPVRPPRKYSRRSLPKGVIYVDITDAHHAQLHDAMQKTRVSARLLLKTMPDVPKGLSAQMVRSWHSGKIQSAETAGTTVNRNDDTAVLKALESQKEQDQADIRALENENAEKEAEHAAHKSERDQAQIKLDEVDAKIELETENMAAEKNMSARLNEADSVADDLFGSAPSLSSAFAASASGEAAPEKLQQTADVADTTPKPQNDLQIGMG